MNAVSKTLPVILVFFFFTLISCSSGAELVKVEDAPPSKCTTKVKALKGTYTGEFHNGLPDGKGKMITRHNGHENTKSGYWDEGTYAGKKKVDPYDITGKRTVGRVSIRHLNRQDNRVEVRVTPGNSHITPTNIKNIRLQGSSGSLHNNTQFRGYKHIDFPFKGRVDFDVRGVQISEADQKGYAEFTINAKGSWLIEIDAM